MKGLWLLLFWLICGVFGWNIAILVNAIREDRPIAIGVSAGVALMMAAQVFSIRKILDD